MARFLTGFGMVIVVVLGSLVLEGGNILNLLALTSFLLAFLVPFFAVVGVWSFKEWGRAFKQAFAKDRLGSEEGARSVALWRYYETSSYLAAVLTMVLAAVLVLGNSPADQILQPKPWSYALTGPFYSLLLAIGARILRARVEDRCRDK